MKEAFEQKLTLLIIKLSLLILLFMSTILFLTGYTLNHSVAFFLVGWGSLAGAGWFAAVIYLQYRGFKVTAKQYTGNLEIFNDYCNGASYADLREKYHLENSQLIRELHTAGLLLLSEHNAKT